MTVEKRAIRNCGTVRVYWVVLDNLGNIQKMSRKPLDKYGNVCYNKDTKKERK